MNLNDVLKRLRAAFRPSTKPQDELTVKAGDLRELLQDHGRLDSIIRSASVNRDQEFAAMPLEQKVDLLLRCQSRLFWIASSAPGVVRWASDVELFSNVDVSLGHMTREQADRLVEGYRKHEEEGRRK